MALQYSLGHVYGLQRNNRNWSDQAVLPRIIATDQIEDFLKNSSSNEMYCLIPCKVTLIATYWII